MRRFLKWSLSAVLACVISLMVVRWLPVHAAESAFAAALRDDTHKVEHTWCWRDICPGLTQWEPLRQRVRQGQLADVHVVTNTLITIQHRTDTPFSGGIARSLRPTRLRDIGIPITDITRLDALITVHNEHGILRGKVIHVDHFGNLITSIGPLRWQGDSQLMLDPGDGRLLTLAAPNCHVRIGGMDIAGIRRFYGAPPPTHCRRRWSP